MAKQTRELKHILIDHIKSHGERWESLAESTIASIKENKGTKSGLTSLSLKIQALYLEGVATQSPQTLRGDLRNVNLGLSTILLMQSHNHSRLTASAWRQGQFEDSFRHLLRAEHSLGGAMAQSQRSQVQSAIAQGKAQMSHDETRSIRAQAIDCLRKGCDPKLSAQKAADELQDIFRWKDGTDVAHRTLAAWIA